jgi:hypothetical protein
MCSSSSPWSDVFLFLSSGSSLYLSFFLNRDEKNIQVIIQGPPEQPNMIKAMDIKSREMTLSWSQPMESTNSPLLSFLIEYTLANGKHNMRLLCTLWMEKRKQEGSLLMMTFCVSLPLICLSFLFWSCDHDMIKRHLESRTRVYFSGRNRLVCNPVRLDPQLTVQSTSFRNQFPGKE